jgi:hypothetical protein
MRAMAVAIPSPIRVSHVLFFFGLCDYLLDFNTFIGVITIVPIMLFWIILSVRHARALWNCNRHTRRFFRGQYSSASRLWRHLYAVSVSH